MSGTILIIDDDGASRIILADWLFAYSYQPIAVGDGLEALTYLHLTEVLPDLILLDVWMPRMNGWQFLTLQRHDPGLAHIPVVLLSMTEDLSRKVAALKVSAYLEKPIRSAELLKVVERYCEPSRLR